MYYINSFFVLPSKICKTRANFNSIQGQCCCAGSRTFVHESVHDEFVEKARARAQRRTVGDPFQKGIEQGPQVYKFTS